VTRPGTETATLPADVIDATSAEVSMDLVLFAASSAAQSPFEDIPVITTATESGFDAYSVPLPLNSQLPPGRPSV
jgi:hypothetical protein